VAAIAMTVNAYKTRALFDGKIATGEVKLPAIEQESPDPAPGKT